MVIPNGVDTEEFKPTEAGREAPQLGRGKVLLFVGDIRTPRKNLDTLLEALLHVPEAQRVTYWREYIARDDWLDPVRGNSDFVLLEQQYGPRR